MKKELERRAYTFEVRALEENGEKIITGRPIVYEQEADLGWFSEVIARGALDGADLTDVRFLVNHDTGMIPLARSRRNNGNSTMKLSVDYEGLNIDYVRLDVENNATARALWSAVRRGDITGMSFMFSIESDKWEDELSDHPRRTILKIGSVVEVSACTFPAYDSTTIEISARSKAELESARRELESVRSRAAHSLESELETLKEKTKILGGKS